MLSWLEPTKNEGEIKVSQRHGQNFVAIVHAVIQLVVGEYGRCNSHDIIVISRTVLMEVVQCKGRRNGVEGDEVVLTGKAKLYSPDNVNFWGGVNENSGPNPQGLYRHTGRDDVNGFHLRRPQFPM